MRGWLASETMPKLLQLKQSKLEVLQIKLSWERRLSIRTLLLSCPYRNK